MSVTNGQIANQVTFNSAFLSRTTDSSTLGKIDLNNAASESGPNVINIQREINSLNSYSGRISGSSQNIKPAWNTNVVGASGDNLFQRTENLVERFLNVSGHTHNGTDGEGPKIDLSTSVVGFLDPSNLPIGVSFWTITELDFSDFSSAATIFDLQIGSVAEKMLIEAVVVRHTTSFTGGSISAYTIDVGITGDLKKYVDAFNVFAAPGSFDAQIFSFGLNSFTTSTDLLVTARSTGANLNAATAGAVEVYVKRSILP